MLRGVPIKTSETLRVPEPHRGPTPPAPATRPGDHVKFTVDFRCNLECQHCMFLESMHWLEPADAAAFQALLDENARDRRWQDLILTGSEVTLRADQGYWGTTYGSSEAYNAYVDYLMSLGVNLLPIQAYNFDNGDPPGIVVMFSYEPQFFGAVGPGSAVWDAPLFESFLGDFRTGL
jgi:hypothetical protein